MAKFWRIEESGFLSDKELTNLHERELRALSAATGTQRIAALERAHKEAEMSKLARGLNSQNSPHSVAAQRAARAAEGNARKAAKATKAPAKAPAAKAARKEAKAVLNNDDTKLTVLLPDFTFGRTGSARNLAWLACTKATTVGAYLSAGGPRKYLGRWQTAGAVKLG